MLRLRDGSAVELPAAFVQRCATLRELRAECGAAGEAPSLAALGARALRTLLAADAAAAFGEAGTTAEAATAARTAVARVLSEECTLSADGCDALALAACVDGANFLGHTQLHAALCACIAADVAALSPLNASAVRARLSLPDDLSQDAAQAARAALAECTALPMQALLPGGADPESGLAGLALDSLLLVFFHLKHEAVLPATLACAAWAYAGLEDAATRLTRDCAFMRDIYCRATGGAMPPAANGRAVATRHVRLATGCATAEDAESLVEACVAAMEDGVTLSGEQLSFTACAIRTALVSTMQQKRSSTTVRTRILAAAAQSAGRAKRETQAALEHGAVPGAAVADALRDADVALARHAAMVLQLSLLGVALEVENWFALPAIAAVTQEALAGLGGALDAVLDAAAGDDAAVLAAASLRAALRPEATADPAAWLMARREARDGQAIASLVPDVGLLVDEDAVQETDAAAEGAEEKEPEAKHAPAAVVVPLPRSVYSRCTIVQALARGSLAMHGAPPPGTLLLLRAPGVTNSVMAHVNAAGASMAATEANGVWPDEHAITFTRALDNSSLFGAILAANALGFQTLLGATTTAVARMMAGKSPEEIRAMFDIKNDFTPEEEEAVRQENQWAFQ